MPGRDGTGPEGRGPETGRALGDCEGERKTVLERFGRLGRRGRGGKGRGGRARGGRGLRGLRFGLRGEEARAREDD